MSPKNFSFTKEGRNEHVLLRIFLKRCGLFSFLLIIWNLFCPVQLWAQDKYLIDSLEKNLKIAPNDTSKAIILYAISKAYWGSDPEKAMRYADQTLKVSQKAKYKRGIGNALNSQGAIYMFKGDYIPAMELFQKSLEIRKEIGDKQGEAWSYNNMGIIYYEQGNYTESLKNYMASLKIRDEIDDKNGIAASYNNIGNIYFLMGNYQEALKNYKASLDIRKQIGYKRGIAECYGNIGNNYLKIGNYTEALNSQYSALKLFQEMEDKKGIAITTSMIGEVNLKQKKYTESLKNFSDALALYKEVEDRDHIASSYNSIGNVLVRQAEYGRARIYLDSGLNLSREVGSIENIRNSYNTLTLLDSSTGNFRDALAHHKLYIYFRDSLVNKENTKKVIQQQMQYDFEKKESMNRAAQEKKDAIALQTRNALISGLLATLVFALVFLRQRNKIARGKRKSDELLLNILPAEVADELKQHGHSSARTFDNVTVMFTDFKDFTKVSAHISPEDLVLELHTCFSAFDAIVKKHRIEKIKTIGDAYMCVSGLPIQHPEHAHDMARAAMEVMDFMVRRKKERDERGEFSFELRIGLNSGSVVAGIVGVNKFSYDIWGDTVNLASRMENTSEAGRINVSGSTYELIRDQFNCTYRGKIAAKNKGDVDMYFLEGPINT